MDLYLARALSALGYDRAALERYALVAAGMERLRDVRGVSELEAIARRPAGFYVEVGALYARNGQYAEAARVLAVAAGEEPEVFETQGQYVRALVKAGKREEAAVAAGGLVVRFKADEKSLALLEEVTGEAGGAGGGGGVIAELRRLNSERPGDRAVLLALVGALEKAGRGPEAEEVLERGLEVAPATGTQTADERTGHDYEPGGLELPPAAPGLGQVPDGRQSAQGQSVQRQIAERREAASRTGELWVRLAHMRSGRGELESAARALVSAAVSSPRDADEIYDELWRLAWPSRPSRLSLRTMARLDVGNDARAVGARDYLTGRLADELGNFHLGKQKLEAAAKAYQPALLVEADRALYDKSRSGTVRGARFAEVQALGLTMGGDALVQAIEGRRLAAQGDFTRSARALSNAVERGVNDVSTQVVLARVLMELKQDRLAEDVLRSALAVSPGGVEARHALVALLVRKGQVQEAMAVTRDWRLARPGSADAKAELAMLMFRAGDRTGARRLAEEILEQSPDEKWAMAAVRQIAVEAGDTETWEASEIERFKRAPRSVVLMEAVIVREWKKPEHGRMREYLRVAEEGAQGDAEAMFRLAVVCVSLDLEKFGRDYMAESLKLDPENVVAANSVAYGECERSDVSSRRLVECERLARMAVAAEQDEAAYWDTLGWVLYKQGSYEESVVSLQRAMELLESPDPVVGQHLGDALWRLGMRKKAVLAWREALKSLEQGGEQQSAEQKKLAAQTAQRLRAVDAGELPEIAAISVAAEGK